MKPMKKIPMPKMSVKPKLGGVNTLGKMAKVNTKVSKHPSYKK